MSTELDLQPLALEMKAAQDSAYQVEPFSARLTDFDLAAAYKIAHLIHRLRLSEGLKAIGRKVGFTNPEMWTKFGVREPIWAYIYDTTVVQLDDTRTTCPLSRFVEPKIEPEIVFGFGAAPQVGAGPTEILSTIEWVAHGFEIVQSHFPGWKFQAPDTVADSSLHGTLLIGPRRPLYQLGDDVMAALESFELTLTCDGRLVETGRGCNVLGSPLTALAHLLSVLANQPECLRLQAGEIVTTGTITTAQSIQPGETWQSELRGIALPGLSVGFSG